MRLLFKIKNQEIIEIQLIQNKHIIGKTHLAPHLFGESRVAAINESSRLKGAGLTVIRSFDIMLIRTLDKILRKNKIERLSLKSVRGEGPVRSPRGTCAKPGLGSRIYEISGQMRPEAVSSMILKTVAKALSL